MLNSVIVAVKEPSTALATEWSSIYGDAKIIQVSNLEATGICAKYNLGIEQALEHSSEGWVVFSHDDAVLKSGNIEASLKEMQEKGADVVGVAGNCKIPSLKPGFWWDGITKTGFRGSGAVVHRTPGLRDVFHVESYGPYPQEVAALDGIWIAVKASCLKDKNLRFESSFPGYHYYDADFCATARSLGYKIWVANLLFLHDKWGKGVEDPSFQEHQQLFINKWQKKKHLYYLNPPRLLKNDFVSSTGALQ